MASVTVDSGEFKLLRNININHQPSRAKVVHEWIKAFDSEVPRALNALADVIEDVYAFPIIWQERRGSSPEEFFESIGITGLNLEDPAKLVRTLRGEMGSDAKAEAFATVKLSRAERIPESKRLVLEDGKSLREAAKELGVDPVTVRNDVLNNFVMTKKFNTPRKRILYQISQYTKPATAAEKIRATFGDEFAQKLKAAL
jgi:hypothetical protein